MPRINRETKIWMPSFAMDAFLSFNVFLVLFVFRRLDFDGGHEGYLLTTAIAQADGFQIYKDYFSLYGSVLPWIQSLVVSISGFQSAINLRILDSLLVAVVFFLILNLRRFIGLQKHGLSQVFLMSGVTWLCLAYFFNGMSQHPWSSTIALAIQLLIVNMLLWLLDLPVGNRSIYIPIFGIGVLLALIPFTRLNVGIATMASTYFILISFSRFFPTYRFSALPIFVINTIGMMIFFAYFLLSNSISDLIEQSILIPRRVFTSSWMVGPENWNAIPVLSRYFWISLPPIILVIFCVLALNKKGIDIDSKLEKKLIIGLPITLGMVLAFCLRVSQMEFWLYQRLIVFIMVFGVILAIVLIARHVFEAFLKSRNSNQKTDLSLIIIAFFGLSGIVQVYPTHDPRHIWWGLPLLIVLAPLALSQSRFLPKTYQGTMIYKLFVLTLASAVFVAGAQKTLSVDRLIIEFDAPFKGMEVKANTYKKLKSEFMFLKQNLDSQSKVFFQCGVEETHWLASFDGNYHSKSPWFVDLSFYPGHPKPKYLVEIGDQMIICGDRVRQGEIAAEFDFTIIAKSEYLAIAELKNLAKK